MGRRRRNYVTCSETLKPIVKLLRGNVGSVRLSEVFEDFVAMSATAVRNAVSVAAGEDRGPESRWASREEDYLRRAARYDAAGMDRFAEALALLTLALESEPGDVLGRLLMELDGGDAGLGQFFTPDSVASLIGSMQTQPMLDRLAEQDFITVYEPACGGGAMLVALMKALREEGVNYQRRVHVVAEDVSMVAVRMTYLQLSLMHVPAIVRHGNTISAEVFDEWPTLAHVTGGWDARLAVARTRAAVAR